MWEHLLNLIIEQLGLFIIGAIGALLAWICKRFFDLAATKIGEQKAEQLRIQFMEAGVRQSWNDFAKWKKEASADGKLDRDEREEARRLAVKFAKTAAKGAGGAAIHALAEYGDDYLRQLGDSIWRRIKDRFTVDPKKDDEIVSPDQADIG